MDVGGKETGNGVSCYCESQRPRLRSPASVPSTPRFIPVGMPAMPNTSISNEPLPGFANGTLHAAMCYWMQGLTELFDDTKREVTGGRHARAEVVLVHLRRVDLQRRRRVHLTLAVRAPPVLLLRSGETASIATHDPVQITLRVCCRRLSEPTECGVTPSDVSVSSSHHQILGHSKSTCMQAHNVWRAAVRRLAQ